MHSRSFHRLVLAAVVSSVLVPGLAMAVWTQPVYHPELNVGGNTPETPCLSANGLTIYFINSVPSAGAAGMFVATRPDLDSAFGAPTMLSELFHGVNLGGPWLSADGLRLYYHERLQPEDRAYIRMAVRSDITQPWVVTRLFEEIHQTGYFDWDPVLTADELVLAFVSDRPSSAGNSGIWIATRNSPDEPFGAPVRVSELSAFPTGSPWFSPDGLTLYFFGHPASDPTNDIYKATRASRTSPFTNIQKLVPFATSDVGEQSFALTPDERSIAYLRVVPSNSSTNGIMISRWYEPRVGYEIASGNYQAEVVGAYCDYTKNLGMPWGMTFGPDGALYLTHEVSESQTVLDGTIYKMTMTGQASRFVTGLADPFDIVWGGGTAYGDYFYVADQHALPGGKIWRISPSGAVSAFATMDSHPIALEIDRAGLYGKQMYTATCTRDKTYSISPAGTVKKFSDFPYDNADWGIGSIAFASGGGYGGLMYTFKFWSTPGLINTLDAAGNPTPLGPDFYIGGQMHFDNTDQQLFGGNLFVRGALRDVDGPPYARTIYYISPDGQASKFLNRSAIDDIRIGGFTFGPDGAMYVAEYDLKTNVTTVSRIVPAGPYRVALENLRRAIAAKEHAIADVNEAVTYEKLAMKALGELMRDPHLDQTTRKGVITATQRTVVSSVQEATALMLLRKSLPMLNEAWDILIAQVEPGIEQTPAPDGPGHRDPQPGKSGK
jgi:hypothetical protein